MINSKQKGNEFELKIAKMLTEWSGEKFHRTPASGALHWENDNRVVSDIVPPQTLVGWPFSIECKKVEGANWEFSAMIEGTSQTLKEHWQQCYGDSQREQMLPMLVFNKNRRNVYMMITEEVFHQLNVHPKSYMNLHTEDSSLVILKFDEFLSLISLQELLDRKLLK